MVTTLTAHVLDSLGVALWLSLPLLLAAWAAGLLSSGLSSFTRLGDATTATVPRQVAVALAIWASATWAGKSLVDLTGRVWEGLSAVGGG